MPLPLPLSTPADVNRASWTAHDKTSGSGQVGRAAWLFVLLVVWVVSGVYVFRLLDHNWIPYDEGLLGQTAERVLLGQMPHRDFADAYTGGLAYLNALGFEIFGLRLITLRYLLFAGFLLWVPAFFYCTSRFVSPAGAGLVTALAVVWTIPNYPAAMPSWYNLFLATLGVAAFFRFIATERRQWLVAAGVMGGCSILVKISGLYFVAAVLLSLLFREGVSAERSGGNSRAAYEVVVSGVLVAFLGGLVALLHRRFTLPYAYHFFLPGAALALLVQRAVAGSAGSLAYRVSGLSRLTSPFLMGVSLPIAMFLVPYIAGDGLAAFMRGVLVSPTTRLASAAFPPMTLLAVIPAALLALAVAIGAVETRASHQWAMLGLLALMPAAALVVGGAEYAYHVTWASVSQSIPLVVVGGALVLSKRLGHASKSAGPEQQLFIVLAAAGLCSMIEFPLSHPTYFAYTAPLTLLAVAAVLRWIGPAPRLLTLTLIGYYGTFAVAILNTRSVNELGLTAAPAQPLARLELDRAGLMVGARDAIQYEAVVDTLKAHARGSYTYAGPDAPEIYFLTGLRNPTRTLFEFLEPAEQSPGRVLAALDRHRVTAVAINRDMKFSAPLSPELEAAFAQRFPHATTVGKFTVRWQ